MSAQRSDSPQWFGAMVSAYGIQAAEPDEKAEAVHTWAERVKAALSGARQENRGDREAA